MGGAAATCLGLGAAMATGAGAGAAGSGTRVIGAPASGELTTGRVGETCGGEAIGLGAGTEFEGPGDAGARTLKADSDCFDGEDGADAER